MRKYSFILITYIISVFSWAILSEDLSLSSIGLGFIISTVILALTQGFISDSQMPAIRLVYFLKMIRYAVQTIVSVYTSAFGVLKGILSNSFELAIVEVDLPSDLEFVNALICNSITLTPGTISVEKNDKKVNVLLLNHNLKSTEELKKEVEFRYKSLKGS